MAVNVAVVGTGYVGLVAAVGLADFGNTVVGVDIDSRKIETLSRGIPVIYEPGIEEYLARNMEAGRLSFTTDIEFALKSADVVFVAVGTPPLPDGSANMTYIKNVVSAFAKELDTYKVIVTKSTVPVGTNSWIKEEICRLNPAAVESENFDVVSNPEFLREGKAVQDFFHPDRIVIGTDSPRAHVVMEELYRALYIIQTPIIWCGLETAELIKYAANAFLACKITFINQMANLAEAVGADIHKIAKAMGMDGRISAKFLHPGPGYGGSCFPKDTRALVATGDAFGVDMSLIRETVLSNDRQKIRMTEKLKRLIIAQSVDSAAPFDGKTIAVLGLTFKSETDDVRESPALAIIPELLRQGARVQAHDPKGMDTFSREIETMGIRNVVCCNSEFDAARDADAVVILTEWNIYRNIDCDRLRSLMKGRIILDTRNILDPAKIREAGFIYEGVGRT